MLNIIFGYFLTTGILIGSSFVNNVNGQNSVQSTTPIPEAPLVVPNKTVCYPYVGCFDNYPPFDNAHLDLPNSPSEVGTQFLLFTRNGPPSGVFLNYTDLNTVTASPYDPAKPTKMIIHGFSNTINTTWMYLMKNELLKKDDFNVLIVAWGPGATFPDYDRAVANTRLVGTQVRLMVDQMTRNGANLNQFHLIGHSLGAHTSGYTGRLLHGRIGRITGLDPAEPDFEKLPMAIRLDASDAKFVDVIHTNGAQLSSGGAGLMQLSGDVDFFPNGGETQPGCRGQLSGVFSDLLHGHFGDVSKTVSCSHSRAHEIFTESINSDCPFTSYPCDSQDKFNQGACFRCSPGCSELGYYADQYDFRGKLYLNTRDISPFCGFHYAIRLTSLTDGKGTVSLRLHGTFGDSEWIKFIEDTDITAGNVNQKVVVSNVEVGDITSMDIKYDKHTHGFLFGSDGQDEWSAEDITVTSGELGTSYFVCARNHRLQSSQVRTLPISTGRSC